MKKEIELLEIEKDKLVEQLIPIEKQIDLIDEKIAEIRRFRPHKNTEIIEAKGKDYYYSTKECKDCGESWLQ